MGPAAFKRQAGYTWDDRTPQSLSRVVLATSPEQGAVRLPIRLLLAQQMENDDTQFARHVHPGDFRSSALRDPLGHSSQAGGLPRGVDRHLLAGRTKAGRGLFVVFTLRRGAIRVISARGLNRKEREWLP